MNQSHCITKTEKFKRLSIEHYEYIILEITKHEAIYSKKRRNTGRTDLIKRLAQDVGASVSTVYEVIKKAKITVKGSDLVEKTELCATASFNRRSKSGKPSNAFKLNKASEFVENVIALFNQNSLTSIDEAIHTFIIDNPEKVKNMTTITTKTMYSYIHSGLVSIRPIDLPRTVQRKRKPNYKTYISKRQKGTSIDQRPEHVLNREEFGHWEGDLVTGPRNGQNGALLTLIERKTRFYYMIPISGKKAKQVYMQINKLEKLFGENFSKVFKSITFDNGSEFSRYKDIEKKPRSKKQRTTVYFAHPYRSCERGSNENCNGLVRRFIKKGTDINTVPREELKNMNIQINKKRRRLFNYESASSHVENELKAIYGVDFNNFYL